MVKSEFSIATHIMTFLARYNEDWITSNHLAKSININPVLVRKEIITLKSAALIISKEGKNGGFKLAKQASKIKLSEIFTAVKGKDHVLEFSKNKGNPDCPIGSQMKAKLDALYQEMDNIIEQSLSNTTLEEFKDQF